MPRPKKCRKVCALPQTAAFGPLLQPPAEQALQMTIDEYETVRLIDLLGCTQEDCAAQMGVARTTVQAVYNEARRKLADALVNGRQLVIRGGNYELCPRAAHCHGRQGCAGRCSGCESCKTDGGDSA